MSTEKWRSSTHSRLFPHCTKRGGKVKERVGDNVRLYAQQTPLLVESTDQLVAFLAVLVEGDADGIVRVVLTVALENKKA